MGMLFSLFKGILSESGRVQPTVKEKQAETDALRKLWRRGQGDPVNGIAIDYSFYSPVQNGADPAKKYPLVIIMAGALEGVVPGFELTANALAYWTAPHIQARFPNGGAYLLSGRAPEEKKLYWDSTKLTAPFKAAIDGFIAANENVDTQRIYSIGWCLGGTGSLNLAAGYPDFFAAAIVITPSRPFSHTEARRLANTPFWLMGCKADNYVSYRGIVQKSQTRLNRYAKDPAHRRRRSPSRPAKGTLPCAYTSASTRPSGRICCCCCCTCWIGAGSSIFIPRRKRRKKIRKEKTGRGPEGSAVGGFLFC